MSKVLMLRVILYSLLFLVLFNNTLIQSFDNILSKNILDLITVKLNFKNFKFLWVSVNTQKKASQKKAQAYIIDKCF